MEIIDLSEETKGKAKKPVDISSIHDTKEVKEAPGNSAQQHDEQKVPAVVPPAPESDGSEEFDKLLEDFGKGTVDPAMKQAHEEAIQKDEPLSEFHMSLLDSGQIEVWMVKILSWGFVWVNVFIYNLVFSGKKKVIHSDIEMDKQDKLMLGAVCKKYAPNILEKLKKVHPILLSLLFMEGSMIANMNAHAQIIEKEKKEEEAKETK